MLELLLWCLFGGNRMLTIAIVGLGARGVSVLERFVSKSLAGIFNEILNIIIFDPSSLGWGCHKPNQSRRLLVNTVASQMSIFYDESFGEKKFYNGPGFYDFLKIKGYQPEKNKYYPRALLGEYLGYGFKSIIDFCKNNENIKINVVHEKILTINKKGKKFVLQGQKSSCETDAVFITTGHPHNKKNNFIFPCYPLNNAIKDINNLHKIAIKGLGLSFIDLITLLTSGKGGSFDKQSGKLVYFPSGNEPEIFAFSRSNLPLMARAITQKEVREQYSAKFFSIENIVKIRKNKKIDFCDDLIPLILKELEYVYSYTYIASVNLEKSFVFRNEYLFSSSPKSIISKYIPEKHRFNFEELINPIHDIKNQDDYNSKLIDYLETDISEARLGNIDSPIKAACDILRDLRDNLRYCVDFGGLTEKSYQYFINWFLPVNNRICVGPPLIRNEELLALIHAGIVNILYNANYKEHSGDKVKVTDGFGNCVIVDRLIEATIGNQCFYQNSLFRSIINNKLGSQFKNGNVLSDGFNITTDFQSVNQDDEKIENLFFLGLPTEGIKFYTFVLPRPFIRSTFLHDSDSAVRACLRNLIHIPGGET